MKTASRTVGKSIAFAVVIGTFMSAAPVWADCYSQQERVLSRIQTMMSRMNSGNTGMCVMARQIKAEYPDILNFYNSCSIVDPDGRMRKHIREMISWANQTESSACEN